VIYLDNNATTALSHEVQEAMLPFLQVHFENPSSAYGSARTSSVAIDRAREEIAELLSCDPGQLVFTSGGTESNNTALNAAIQVRAPRRHIVTTGVEHPSVYNYCRHLEASGYSVTYLPVDSEGRLELQAVAEALTEDTAVLSLMAANNETGVLFPVAEAARLASERGVPVHSDTVQAVGKIPVSASDSGVDYLAASAHKLHGPKGIGVLYVSGASKYVPYLYGGDQEYGRRPGTENVAAIVGFGAAARLAREGLAERAARMKTLRDNLERRLAESVDGIRVAGAGADRLPNTSLVLVEGAESETVLTLLDMQGICCSSGSACATGSPEPSRVLLSMGLSKVESGTALRFSLGRETTERQIDETVEALGKVVSQVRSRRQGRSEAKRASR
jgi:cysteine desulfurase